MTPKQIKKWIDRNKELLYYQYGVEHYIIEIIYLISNEDYVMSTTSNYPYEGVTIKIALDQITDTEQLECVFRHELCHVVLSMYDAYHGMVEDFFKEREKYSAYVHIIEEQAAVALERMSRRHRGMK